MCLFNCIEWLREQLQQWQETAELATKLQDGLDLNSSVEDSGASHSCSEDDSDAPDLQELPESSGRVSWAVG